jgi:hypothetical protein
MCLAISIGARWGTISPVGPHFSHPQIVLCYIISMETNKSLRKSTPAANTVPDAAAAAVLTKAFVNAAKLLQIRQVTAARILGVSVATMSRLWAGAYQLDPARKEWELAVLLVRMFRSLDSILGSHENARLWLAGPNLALAGKPIELIESTEGLVRVIHYLDAHRGRV